MTGLSVHLPILQVIVPLFAALTTALTSNRRLAWLIVVAASLASFVIAILLALQVHATGQPISYVIGGWTVPYGIEYRVDQLNSFVLLIVTLIATALSPYSRASVDQEVDADQQPWFYALYLLCLAGLLGMTISGDAFNIFVFMEISSLSTYALIAMGTHRRALLSAYQYLIVGTIGATFYVIGVGILYLATGSLNLADITARLANAAVSYDRPVLTALAFLSAGICLKLALFPLHVWLPNAYAYAPSTISAFLAGTATKVAVYILIRIYYSVYGVVFGIEDQSIAMLLILLSAAAMLVASFSAIFEENSKRMMAYSSVAQIGYITLGIALANASGLTGGIVHLFNHAITKAALFMALGSVAWRLGSVQLSDMAGLGKRMPVTTAVMMTAGLGLIGIPGTAGFISKWYLMLGAIEHGYWPVVVLIAASSLLAVVYVWRLVETAYFHEPSEAAAKAGDPPFWMLAPMVTLALLTVVFGLATDVNAGLARAAAEMLIGGAR